MPRPEATPARSRDQRARLRTRRGLLLTALPIIFAIAGAGIVLAVSHRNAAADDRRTEVRALAAAAANNASRFVSGQFTILETVGLSDAVQGGDYTRMRPFLERVAEQGSFSSSLFFVDRRARIQATRNSNGVSLADRHYVQAALGGREVTSEVLIARVSKSPIVTFARPVTGPDGRPRGALVGSLRLNEVSDALERLLYAPDAREFLIDDSDHLILADRPVRSLRAPPAALTVRRRLATSVGDIAGSKRLIGYAPVPNTDWTASVHVGYGATIGPLNTALTAEVVALVILAALGTLATFTAARRLEGLELERDDALAEQSRIAAQLQRSMLPGLPSPEGAELEARYAPAQSELSVGGDWYDVVDLGEGRIAASIGDVAGHGLASAAVMGQLRSAIRTLSLSGHHPGVALTELDRFTALVDGRPLATVVQVVLDTRDGLLRYACAGHPSPLLVRADGRADFLDEGRSPLLGIAPGEARDEGVEVLLPGDTLVIYTDGLIERPDSSIDAGMERLRARAIELGTDPAALAEDLLAAVPEPRRDDVAILCLRLLPVARVAEPV